MRSFVALLTLLLALPGLLLPAGALWHLCGCAERGLPAQSCCVRADASRASADPDAPKPQRSCCAAKAKTGDETPQLVADDCGCEWLPIADEQPVRNTPEPPPLLLALPPQPCFEPRATFVATNHRAQAWSPTASRPPPPDAQRSLPLRL